MLGDVDTCPHGHAIPDENGKIKQEKSDGSFRVSSTARRLRILAVDNEDPGNIEKASKSRDCRPGAIVTILKKETKTASLEDRARPGERVRLDAEATASVLTAEPSVTLMKQQHSERRGNVRLGKLGARVRTALSSL